MNDQPTLATLTEDQLADLLAEAAAYRNQPALRHCLVPGCLREYDAIAGMNGRPPARESWSMKGWRQVPRGVARGNLCPDHVEAVSPHLPTTIKLPGGRWTVACPCEWTAPPQTWPGMLLPLWQQHLLTTMGKLPAPAPLPDPDIPGTRIPLAEHTEDTLTELYDRLWDAEADYQETREVARACILNYNAAVPALLGAKIALEHLRTRLTLDSRDWAADKVDALLYAVLVGWNCENTDEGHVHNDIDCAGNQGLWNIANQHNIPTDQTIQASHHRWWVANAIKVAKQIEDRAKEAN